MSFPYYIHIGDTKILLHLVTEVMAFFIAFRYYVWLKKSQGDAIAQNKRLLIILGATIGALLGSRLVGGLEDPPAMMSSENLLQYFYINKTVVGGFLGGLFGVEMMKKAIHEKSKSGDLFTYPMILGLIIGRIGCFSMGVHELTFGVPTQFFAGMDLGDGVLRHPVALYEILFLAMVWVFIFLLKSKYLLVSGAQFKIFMMSYLLFRFFIDFIKPHYTFSFGLSTIQIVCAVGLLYYAAFIYQPKKLLQQNA